MQIVVNGKAVNFGDTKYQVPLGADACSAELTKSPIHFHDNKNQMVHIHWDGITGGMVLKYYGWDYIGGIKGALGYRFDNLPLPKKVPSMGNLLPAAPTDAKLYVYTDANGRPAERKAEDFLKKDLEDFFGKKSTVPGESVSFFDRLFPKAAAHGGAHADDEPHPEAELKRINNLIGDVVLFVQKDRPASQQVHDRFDTLEPLSDSTCAG
jgi:hypothetical protein